MNRIWFLQTLPAEWKHSVIIPSYKPGKNSSDPQSYRTIALTSNFVKIMEKMGNNRLRWFLENNNLYSPNQSGFRKKNTMEQIVRLDNDIQKAFLKKHFTVGVFIDFQKAFDMLWRHGLLKKMVQLGIRGNMLGWVDNFLTNRTIQVKINNTYSEIHVVQNGTPQGSCISPTLFNIMVNDLSDCIKSCAISQFADDGAIWLSGKNSKYVEKKVQSDLDNINLWCEKWGFLISPTKTVVVIFNRKKNIGEIILKLGNNVLSVVKEIKFLGMILDEKLTWLKHIQYVHLRCTKVLNCMKLLTGTKWGANSSTLRTIYISLIRSKIDYGCEVYNTASKNVKNILDRIQSQALRICTGAHKTACTNSLQVEMGDPPYEERRKSLILKSYLNILSHNNLHPCKNSITNTFDYEFYSKNIKENQKPYCITADDVCSSQQIDTNSVYKFTEYPTPPWHVIKPVVKTQLREIITKKDNPHLIKSEGNILIDSQYKEFLKIYTDGSKDPDTNNSACAFVVPELKIKKGFKLCDHASIFMCELTAIFLCLTWLEEFRPDNVVIFVDSLSALQAITGSIFKVKSQIIYDIFHLVTSLTRTGMNIVFEWIPSHVGLMGNEMADQAAKSALSLPVYNMYTPLYKEDIKCLSKRVLKTIWQKNWDDIEKGRRLYQIQNTVNFCITIPNITRQREVILYKLRSGYIATNSFLYKIGKSTSRECDICHVTDDLEHYLFVCQKYARFRNELFNNLKSTGVTDFSLKNILSGRSTTLVPLCQYLSSTGMWFTKPTI